MKPISTAILAFFCILSSVFAQIESGQSVIINILGVPAEEKAKIDSTYPVSNRGMVNMPFIGDVHANGLQAADLAKKIEATYRDKGIYENANIQVLANQRDIAPVVEQVHLGGHVKQPGPRPFTKGLTVFQAVQAAGGADIFGAMNRVVLTRDGKELEINLKKAAGKAVVAQPNDTIVVPEKNIIGN